MSDVTFTALDPSYLKNRKQFEQGQNKLQSSAWRVLLVEDCGHTRALIGNMLKRYGLEVTAVADGESFVRMAFSSENMGRPFDLVLLDINLPKLNGVEATRLLRKAGYERPIIAITAGPSLRDRKVSIYAGCDSFLAKSELHLTLKPLLKQYLEIK